MSRSIQKHSVVTLHVEMRDEQGSLLDSTRSTGQPLVYVHGTQTLLPGLEELLEGKAVGDCIDVVLPPEKAFGQVDKSLMQVVPVELFEGMELRPGMEFGSQSDSYQTRTVTAVENGQVTLDANHPMAGKSLHIDAQVLFIRAATQQEIEEGI